MNPRATAIYEKVTGLLDAAAQDPHIPPDDFYELLADVYDFCGSGLKSLDAEGGGGGEGDDEGGGEEQRVDDADERENQ